MLLASILIFVDFCCCCYCSCCCFYLVLMTVKVIITFGWSKSPQSSAVWLRTWMELLKNNHSEKPHRDMATGSPWLSQKLPTGWLPCLYCEATQRRWIHSFCVNLYPKVLRLFLLVFNGPFCAPNLTSLKAFGLPESRLKCQGSQRFPAYWPAQ